MKQKKVGIYLFEDVEVLDFSGPFEVFAVTSINRDQPEEVSPFHVTTFSESGQIVSARNGLKVTPDYSLDTAPDYDIVVFPGGPGVSWEINNERVISWIRDRGQKVELMTSVCTGVYFLAKAGLLEGKRATTHSLSIPYLRKFFPNVTVLENVKFVDEGNVISSAGISAGLHMAFHVVHRLYGIEVAQDTARYMEYDIEF